MPLLAGTGQQAFIAALCFLVGLATSPLYEWTRPLKRKNPVLEFVLDAFYMLAAGGTFLLFTHNVLAGILSFYTVISFFVGAAVGVFVLRKTSRFLLSLLRPLISAFTSRFVAESDAAEVVAPEGKKTSKKLLKLKIK